MKEQLAQHIDDALLTENIYDELVRSYITGVVLDRQSELTTHRRRIHYVVSNENVGIVRRAERFILQNSLGAELMRLRTQRDGAPPLTWYMHKGQELYVVAAAHHSTWKDVFYEVAKNYPRICRGIQQSTQLAYEEVLDTISPFIETDWDGSLTVTETKNPF